MIRRVILLQLAMTAAAFAAAPQPRQWTERENLGFHGTVHSVVTTVARLNLDPRPAGKRNFAVEQNPDWIEFDMQGRRIGFGSASSPDGIKVLTKCTFEADGKEACNDSTGHRNESEKQETTLADGGRELSYYYNSALQSREVTHYDKDGRATDFRDYNEKGHLISEESTQFGAEGETAISKIYDQSGRVASHMRTFSATDGSSFSRRAYDPEGRLVWYLQLDADGELVSSWYAIGYKPKMSSSGSLGICLPKLCVSYKFDEAGSGRLERSVQHTPGSGNLEPDSEEHYGFDGNIDEKIQIEYVRDAHGNWTSRSVFIWDPASNQTVETERDTRTIQYY